MRYRRLIIDGYSLLHQDKKLAAHLSKNLMAARQRLIRAVERIAGAMSDATTIVFDGREQSSSNPSESTSIEIVFSPSDKTADTVIERIAHADARPGEILVVTSDRSERETVTAAGAEVMSCAQFLDLCQLEEKEMTRTLSKSGRQKTGSTLGDFFPDKR